MATNRFPAPDARGYIYLVHFSGRTEQHRQHYLGFSANLERRYDQHRFGRGAGETKKAIAEGLKLTVAQTWKGTPSLEKRLKEWSCRQILHASWVHRPCVCIRCGLRQRRPASNSAVIRHPAQLRSLICPGPLVPQSHSLPRPVCVNGDL
jgi:predicted GIY-YIG superfamily endonuclease